MCLLAARTGPASLRPLTPSCSEAWIADSAIHFTCSEHLTSVATCINILTCVECPAVRWKDMSAGRLDWDTFLEAKRQELKRLNKIYRDNLQKWVACSMHTSTCHAVPAVLCSRLPTVDVVQGVCKKSHSSITVVASAVTCLHCWGLWARCLGAWWLACCRGPAARLCFTLVHVGTHSTREVGTHSTTCSCRASGEQPAHQSRC
jgi:hypothetical protein